MDPPSRFDFTPNPYFLLPQRKLLSSSRNNATPSPKTTRSIKTIYGKVELMSDRKQADFLLRLMTHSDIKPNFEAMASALGLPGEGAVRQRFKSLCEMNKFKFSDANKVEATDALPDFDKATLNPSGTVDDGDGDAGQGKGNQGQEQVKTETANDATKPKRKRAYKRKEKPKPAADEGEGKGKTDGEVDGKDDDDKESSAEKSEKPKAKKPKTSTGKATNKAATAAATGDHDDKGATKGKKAVTTKPTTKPKPKPAQAGEEKAKAKAKPKPKPATAQAPKKKPAAAKQFLSAEKVIEDDEESDGVVEPEPKDGADAGTEVEAKAGVDAGTEVDAEPEGSEAAPNNGPNGALDLMAAVDGGEGDGAEGEH